MARINIEDSIYKSDKFLQLVINVGDKNKALGILVSAWTLAQKYYLDENNERLIPLNARTTEIDELIKVGLAVEKSKKGYYLKGSDEQFAWLLQKSAAGKKSAQTRKNKAAKAPKPNKKKDNPTPVNGRATAGNVRSTDVNLLSPSSLLLSPSQSLAQTPTQKELGLQDLNRKVWDAYKTSYMKKYKVEPVRNAKVNNQISQFAKRLGAEAIEVVRFYLEHPKSFYVSKMHEFGICLADAEALRTQWARGRAVTENDLKRYSKNQEQQQLLDAIERGEV